LPKIEFREGNIDSYTQSKLLGRWSRSFLRAFQRTAVNRVDLPLRQTRGQARRLSPANIVQMHARQPAGNAMADGIR